MNVEQLKQRLRDRLPSTITDLRDSAREHAPDAVVRREAGYSIRNAAGDEAVVRIYDEIWWLGVNAQDLVAELDAVTAPKMRVEINSPGGDVFDGIAIYNALRNHPAHVTTRIDGLAASIASVIAQAGDHRVMLGASQMMIHNAWGLAVGDTQDHADMAELLEQQDGVIAGIYAQRSGQSVDHFRALMSAETWLTTDAAVEHGLADEVIEPERKEQPAARTFHDKISDAVAAVEEAVSSAESVSAVRAEVGKTLSNRNVEGLNELRASVDRLDGLLQKVPEGDRFDEAELAAMRDRADAALFRSPELTHS